MTAAPGTPPNPLAALGIVSDGDGDAVTRFVQIAPDFATIPGTPREYVLEIWRRHTQTLDGVAANSQAGINGKILEYALATMLHREGFTPFWMGAKVGLVPNVEFDIMLYAEGSGPVCISAKVSLRERYKQADLEAFALKNVFRRSKCWLITMSEREARVQHAKIASGDIIGLDAIIHPDSPEFDAMIAELRTLRFIAPEPVAVVRSGRQIG